MSIKFFGQMSGFSLVKLEEKPRPPDRTPTSFPRLSRSYKATWRHSQGQGVVSSWPLLGVEKNKNSLFEVLNLALCKIFSVMRAYPNYKYSKRILNFQDLKRVSSVLFQVILIIL